MNRKILQHEVVIDDVRDFFGRKSSIRFRPSTERGWWFETKRKNILPLDLRIATSKTGRIQLYAEQTELNVYEHIGAGRFWGIDNIIIVPETPWTPYLTAQQYIERLLPFCKEVSESIPAIFIAKESSIEFDNQVQTFGQIKPHTNLKLLVYSKWSGLPSQNEILCIDSLSEDRLREICSAKPQGFPHWRKNFGKIGSLLGWPHMKNVSWRNSNIQKVSYEWWLHAVQDTLGALSLYNHVALPRFEYIRFCGGHALDIQLQKEVARV